MFLSYSYFETDLKSVLHGASDDESVPNTYDYDDSFIDDSKKHKETQSDDEEFDESEEEDIRRLVKEAKGFIRSKKEAEASKNDTT